MLSKCDFPASCRSRLPIGLASHKWLPAAKSLHGRGETGQAAARPCGLRRQKWSRKHSLARSSVANGAMQLQLPNPVKEINLLRRHASLNQLACKSSTRYTRVIPPQRGE